MCGLDVWRIFGLVWCGMAWFIGSFNAIRFLDWTEYPRIPDPIPGPHVRPDAGWSLADDVAVLRPGCPLGNGDPPDPFVLVDQFGLVWWAFPLVRCL